MRPHFESWGDRFSERKERREKEEKKERDWVEKEGAEVEEIKEEGAKIVLAS